MPHPEAAKPLFVTGLGTQLDGESHFEGDICDDTLLLLFNKTSDPSVRTAIWNWRTGERLFYRVRRVVPLTNRRS